MNEQIREILSRCQLESIDGPEYPRWTDLEKFAELIVQECIDVVEDAGGIDKYHYTGAIRKHFGVGE